MNRDNRLTSFNLILLISGYGILLGNISYLSIAMIETKLAAWLVVIISGFLALLCFFLLPRKFIQDYDKILKENKLFSFIVLLYCLLNTSLIVFSTSIVIGMWFYTRTNVNLLVLISIGCISIISRNKAKIILRLGTILIIFYVLQLLWLFDSSTTHYALSLTDFNFSNKILTTSFIIISLFLDNIIMVFNNKEFKNGIKRHHLQISSLIMIIILAIQLIDAFLLVDYKYFDNIYLPSVQRYLLHNGNKYFEHFDIFLLYTSLAVMTFKGCMYLNIGKNTFFRNKSPLYYLIAISTIIIIDTYLIKHSLMFYSLLKFNICLIIPIFIMIIIFERRNKYAIS